MPPTSRRRSVWYRWAILIVAIGGLLGATLYLGRCRPAGYEYQLVVQNSSAAPVAVIRTRPILGPPVTVAPGERVELPSLSGDEARQRVVYEVRSTGDTLTGCLTDNPETEWQRLKDAEGIRGGRLQTTLRVPADLVDCADPRLSR